MILKLTFGSDNAFLIDSTNIVFVDNPVGSGTKVYNVLKDEDYYVVKETIEEIIQQIKEGGITNGTN